MYIDFGTVSLIGVVIFIVVLAIGFLAGCPND